MRAKADGSGLMGTAQTGADGLGLMRTATGTGRAGCGHRRPVQTGSPVGGTQDPDGAEEGSARGPVQWGTVRAVGCAAAGRGCRAWSIDAIRPPITVRTIGMHNGGGAAGSCALVQDPQGMTDRTVSVLVTVANASPQGGAGAGGDGGNGRADCGPVDDAGEMVSLFLS